jgi:hypothetical protein
MSCTLTQSPTLRRVAASETSTPSAAQCPGSTSATAVLDHAARPLHALADEAGSRHTDSLGMLRTAHHLISSGVRPVYSLAELRPASRTLALGRGSCSQRMAVLEAVARGQQIPTRVRGLLVDGSFWAERFHGLEPALPEVILLAWPQFRLPEHTTELQDGEGWLDLSDLFTGTVPEPDNPFTNADRETLFDAVARGAADWRRTADLRPTSTHSCACVCASGLGQHLRQDLGLFTSRDELFAAYGQNLRTPVRLLVGPVLDRMRAA